MNDSTDGVLLALMARLIRIESMVCSLSILCMKHMSDDNVDEYRALAKWTGAMRDRIIDTSVESSAEQFPELAKFLEEHGFIDFVVHRKDLRSEVARLVDFCVK